MLLKWSVRLDWRRSSNKKHDVIFHATNKALMEPSSPTSRAGSNPNVHATPRKIAKRTELAQRRNAVTNSGAPWTQLASARAKNTPV